MTVKEFMEKTFVNNEYNVRAKAVCEDGYMVSIQGGTGVHYCRPRELSNCYEELELGFPSILDDELAKYAEVIGTCETIFGYVPISVVESVISKHGGIIGQAIPVGFLKKDAQ